MGHQQRCAREGRDRLFEHFERGNVEIVGWLVEHENIGGLEHHARNMRAREFAARKHRHRLKKLFIAEQKPPRPTLHMHLNVAEANLLAER